jgi:hypothetical protein
MRARFVLGALLALAATGCALDRLAGNSAPRAADVSLGIASDSVLVAGVPTTLTPQLPPGAADGPYRVRWTSSNAQVLRVDSLTGVATGVAAGRCTVRVAFTSPELDGVATASRAVRVRFSGLALGALDTLTALGATRTLSARGTTPSGAALGPVTAVFASSDTTVVAIAGAAATARRNGSVTITASFDGQTAIGVLAVRQVAARVVARLPSLLLSTGADTANPVVRITDARDSAMTARVQWSSSAPSVVLVDSTGRLTALAAGTATITALVDTARAQVPVQVVVPGVARRVVVLQEPPASVVAGTSWPSLIVGIADSLGALSTTATGSVSLSLLGPAGTSLGGVTTATLVNGRATFTGLRLTRAATGYRVVASRTGLAPDTTTAVTVVPAPPSRLTIEQAPTGGLAGQTLRPLVVAVTDSLSNRSGQAPVTVTLSLSGGAAGANLVGSTPRNTDNAVVTFDSLQVTLLGTNYRITANAPGLAGTQSAAFNITGQPTQLAFTVQPSNALAASANPAAITVQVRDAAGTLVTGANDPVTLSLQTAPPSTFAGAPMSGTLTVNAVSGIATFADARVRYATTATQRLVASSGILTTATSNTFVISPSTAVVLNFRPDPPASYTASASAAIGGTTANPAVEALDSLGNRATAFSDVVSLSLAGGTTSATLAGTTQRASLSGITATYNDLRVTTAGTGYQLVATAQGVAPDTSTAFAVLPATVSSIRFRAQPGLVAAGATITPALVVEAVDLFGNLVTSISGTVSLAIVAGTGTSGATLTGNSAGLVQAVATFNASSINLAGTSYRVRATLVVGAGSFTVTSDPFTVALP